MLVGPRRRERPRRWLSHMSAPTPSWSSLRGPTPSWPPLQRAPGTGQPAAIVAPLYVRPSSSILGLCRCSSPSHNYSPTIFFSVGRSLRFPTLAMTELAHVSMDRDWRLIRDGFHWDGSGDSWSASNLPPAWRMVADKVESSIVDYEGQLVGDFVNVTQDVAICYICA
jgi:hypothetical protein